MTYLYWHALGAVLAMWLLIRTVSCSNVVGILAMISCAILGPLALATAAVCALLSMNADQPHTHIDHGRDAEFYKHKHDRRHH